MPRITNKMEREDPERVHRIRMADPAYARQYLYEQVERKSTDNILNVLYQAHSEMGKDGDFMVVAPEPPHLRPKVAFVIFKSREQKARFWKIVNAKNPGLEQYVNEGQ